MAENRLLGKLSADLYSRLEPHFKHVFLEQGTIIHFPGETIEHVFFPVNCLISITVTMEDGSIIETGLVGNYGVSGIGALMGNPKAHQTEHIIQIPGYAMQMSADALRQEFESSLELRDIILRYTQAFIAQISQTSACRRAHLLEQRFARWLLEVQFFVGSDRLLLTHRFISHMLGVRRASVTQAAQKLQDAGLIRYNHGYVQILDTDGLNAFACECFSVIEDEYIRLLGR